MIYGFRKDINYYVNSIYEANICRIFEYENKNYIKYSNNEKKYIIMKDIDGLFYKNSYIIAITYIDEKIKLIINKFKRQNPNEKLLVISDDCKTDIKPDILYSELEKKYKPLIPLWETKDKNLKKYPELYNEKWIEGKREQKRKHHKLLKLDHDFNLKIGFLWSHQPFDSRPKYNNKFVKTFEAYCNNKLIIEDENWGSILSKVKQYIKDNAMEFYKEYKKIVIKGYCKSEDIKFDIVEFDILECHWY